MNATCKTCGAPIKWVLTEGGSQLPLDAVPVKRWIVNTVRNVARPADTYETHFATCPHAAKHRKPRGFTMVEVLVVVVIVAVLLALLLPGLSVARAGARGLACRANMRQLHDATFARWVAEGQGRVPLDMKVGDYGPEHIEIMPWCPLNTERWPYFYLHDPVRMVTSGINIDHPDLTSDEPLWFCSVPHLKLVTWAGSSRGYDLGADR